MSQGQHDLLNHYARKILTSRVYDVAVETRCTALASCPSGWAIRCC